MSRIKGKDTKPEVMLRKYLFSQGLRGYRVKSSVIGRPDIVFTRYKVAIFVDGCFWHKCPLHYKEPKTNTEFWRKKIERNLKRDNEVNRQLKAEGWTVLRFHECSLRKNDLNKLYEVIIETIRGKSNDHKNT